MKTTHTLEGAFDLDLTVFAINSHVKGYNLCWHINKGLGLSLKKNRGAVISEKEIFPCFVSSEEKEKVFLVQNKSKTGVLLAQKKKIDFFLIFEPGLINEKKKEFISKLSKSSKILLIFELDLEIEPQAHRLVFND